MSGPPHLTRGSTRFGGGTFLAAALTSEGLVLVADSRRRVGSHFCDNVEKIHELTAPTAAVFAVAGLECAANRQPEEGTDPCRSFDEAEKCFDLRRVVRSVLDERALSQTVVSDLTRAMVPEAAGLDREQVRRSTKPLSCVVVVNFDQQVRMAKLGIVEMGAGDDGVARISDLRPYLVTLSAAGVRSHRGSTSNARILCFGDVPYLEQNAPMELERVRELQRRLGSISVNEFKEAGEALLCAVASRPDSPVGGNIRSVVLGREVSRRS